MAGPNHGPGRGPGGRGGIPQKPKNMGKTIARLGKYVAKNKLALVFVLICLAASVATNLGGTYVQRGIINDFLYSGCNNYLHKFRSVINSSILIWCHIFIEITKTIHEFIDCIVANSKCANVISNILSLNHILWIFTKRSL